MISDPTPIPWEGREPARFPTSQPNPMQGAARITSDIALIGYGEEVTTANQPANSYLAVATIYLCAVRYTDDGPELGPSLVLPSPEPFPTSAHILHALIAGKEGEAWMLTIVEKRNTSTSYIRVARVTVDSASLEVFVSWRPTTIPLPAVGISNVHADLWLAGRTLMMTMSYYYASFYRRPLYLVNIDTGALAVSADLPPGRNITTMIEATTCSFHPERQEVLVMGDRITGGDYRPSVFTAPITSTSIGAWTRIVPPFPASVQDITSEVWRAIPLPGGRWKIFGSYWMDDYQESYYDMRHYIFTPPSSIVRAPTKLSTLALGEWMNYTAPLDAVLNDDGTVVVGIAEETDRNLTREGTGVGGIRHVLLADDATTIVESEILPLTFNSYSDDGSVDIVSLGGSRFIYLVSGSGITVPLAARLASWEFLIYIGGATVKPPFVPGIKGEAPDENRRAFRRVN